MEQIVLIEPQKKYTDDIWELCGKVETTVPSYMYLAVCKRDDKVVGVIDFRSTGDCI